MISDLQTLLSPSMYEHPSSYPESEIARLDAILGQKLVALGTEGVHTILDPERFKDNLLSFIARMNLSGKWHARCIKMIALNLNETLYNSAKKYVAPPLPFIIVYQVYCERPDTFEMDEHGIIIHRLKKPLQMHIYYDTLDDFGSPEKLCANYCTMCRRKRSSTTVEDSRLFFDFQHGHVPLLQLGAYVVFRLISMCCNECRPRFMKVAPTCFEKMLHAKGRYPLHLNRICAHCGVVRKVMQKCEKCRRVNYCSSECQLADWREGKHKAYCQGKH